MSETHNSRGLPTSLTTTSGWKTRKVILSTILIACLAVLLDHFLVTPVFLNYSNQGRVLDSTVEYVDETVDETIMSMFVTYDENLDGVIDLSEFVKVANRILHRKKQENLPESTPLDSVPDWDVSGEQITLMSSFKPLVLSTMTKYSEAQPIDNEQPLQGLKSWKNAAVPLAKFPLNAFASFLPNQFWSLSLGESWYIIEPRISKFGPSLSSDRYYPPVVKGKLTIFFRLLAMFHPRPFLLTRFGPQGTMACVRAENQDYWDIVFRIHAEFQLNEVPLLPFWFTPAQFLGNIVIRKDGHHIQSFHMAVPTNRSLNVDMEWLIAHEPRSEKGVEGEEGSSNMEVDIGYLPQMMLTSTVPTALNNENTEGRGPTAGKIMWDREISFEEAHRALEVKMYAFKQVPYLSFQDAIKEAKMENKLVHHILLWGALDDQSC